MTQPALLTSLAEALTPLGLRLRGGFVPVPKTDAALLALRPDTRTVLLIGNAGSEMWLRSGAAIKGTGEPHPLDRWTRAVMEPIAAGQDGTALFPFDGPPYWPFQRWAERAEGVRNSPLGIQIHPEFGLWHAYRAAILLPDELNLPEPQWRSHPCDTCAERPCLSACPVGAFTGTTYEVDHCVDHVVSSRQDDQACFQRGCLARIACPVGAAWRYEREHAAFHMDAFVTARLAAR
jgi:ferredoxin